MVFRLMVIVEITTWWKILSNLIKEDFKVAKDSQGKEGEGTRVATEVCIIDIFCIICSWKSFSWDSNQKLLESSCSDQNLMTALSSLAK